MVKKLHRKKPFVLIEVLVAFAFASLTLFFVLSLQSTFIKKTKHDLFQLQSQERSFEALSCLIELLYENKIPLSAIQNEKEHTISLTDSWKAVYEFSHKRHEETKAPNTYQISVKTRLLYNDTEISSSKNPVCFTISTQAINVKPI